MYNELFVAWKIETETPELSSLPANFYTRIVDYLQHLNQASNVSSEKNVKAKLLANEAINAKRMVEELVSIRYRKIINHLAAGQKVPAENLTIEEANLSSHINHSVDDYNKFIVSFLSGQDNSVTATHIVAKVESVKVEEPQVDVAPPHAKVVPSEPISVSIVSNKRVAVRFLKPVPSIIGADMKSYGPFLVEDVASVPELNAKILVKQGLAKLVELA